MRTPEEGTPNFRKTPISGAGLCTAVRLQGPFIPQGETRIGLYP